MAAFDIAKQRLGNQGLIQSAFDNPVDVVSWLGAVQSQDYFGAKWALGLRIPNAIDDSIEKAFQNGSFLRTHLMRPTWHFVTPADIRWLLKLTAPRVHATNAFMYRKTELDQKVFKRSNAVIEKALQGSKQLTRDELRDVFTKAGIKTEGEQRMAYLLMQAELDGVICSGPRKGKQFTYMLLEERVPLVRELTREEALIELTKRYFTSRGPASVQDYAKWSGLTISDTKHGLDLVKSEFQSEIIDGQTYWFKEDEKAVKIKSPIIHLLSIYDEYISGYKDRTAMGGEKYAEKLSLMGNDLTYIITLDGKIIGTWKRTLEKNKVIIKPDFFMLLKKTEKEAFTQTAEQYGAFLNLSVIIEYK